MVAGDAATPLLAVHKALRAYCAAMTRGKPDPLHSPNPNAARDEQRAIHETVDLETMLAIVRRTVER